jgi:hypothetical protein
MNNLRKVSLKSHEQRKLLAIHNNVNINILFTEPESNEPSSDNRFINKINNIVINNEYINYGIKKKNIIKNNIDAKIKQDIRNKKN